MVDFTKTGILGVSVTDSFADVKQRLDDVRERNDFGFDSVRGALELNLRTLTDIPFLPGKVARCIPSLGEVTTASVSLIMS